MSLKSPINRVDNDNKLDGRNSWYRLTYALAFSSIGGIGLWSSVVVLPAIELEFMIDRSNASMPYAATMIGFGVGGVAIGYLVDRIGIFIPMLICSSLMGIGYIASSLTTSISEFVFVQAILIGMFGSSITLGPLIADTSLWFARRRGIAVSIVASGNYLAGTIWPPILQYLIEENGWRYAHIVLGLICLVTMIPLSFAFRKKLLSVVLTTTISRDENNNCDPISKIRIQVLLIIAGICCCVAMSMPQIHIVAYCGELGFGIATGAEMLSVMLGTGIISRIFFGVISDYIGGLRTLIFGSTLQTLGLLLYLISSELNSLYLISAFFGLAQGGIVPSYALIVRDYFPASQAASRVSLVMMSTIVGMAFGGWLSGEIFDLTGSYFAAFLNGLLFNSFK